MKINIHHEVASELLGVLGQQDHLSVDAKRVISQLAWAAESDPARAHLTAAEFDAIAVAIRCVLSADFVTSADDEQTLKGVLGKLRSALPKVELQQDRARRQEAEERGLDPGWPRVRGARAEERQPSPDVVERNERLRRSRLTSAAGGPDGRSGGRR